MNCHKWTWHIKHFYSWVTCWVGAKLKHIWQDYELTVAEKGQARLVKQLSLAKEEETIYLRKRRHGHLPVGTVLCFRICSLCLTQNIGLLIQHLEVLLLNNVWRRSRVIPIAASLCPTHWGYCCCCCLKQSKCLCTHNGHRQRLSSWIKNSHMEVSRREGKGKKESIT